jgi:hypothetical protein
MSSKKPTPGFAIVEIGAPGPEYAFPNISQALPKTTPKGGHGPTFAHMIH